MQYCKRCVYPANTAIDIKLDENGVCAGCRYFDELETVDWDGRKKALEKLLVKYRNSNHAYDCIIPVSGGKDSHYQVHLIKEVYGLKPLLVTFNHVCSPYIGIKNMANIVEKFKVDHVRFTPNPDVVRKLMKYTLKRQGDLCWFCQTGVVTVPIRVAAMYKIPLIIWGEHGWSHLFGLKGAEDNVEFSVEERRQYFMRGLSMEQVLKDNPDITARDLDWCVYPSEKEIADIGIRGIYLGNYYRWRQKELTEFVIKSFGFTTRPKARTYNTYADVDCHLCSGTNDYLKYLKFGYGRTTDHASLDIREGRITREEAIQLVKKFDHVRPEDLDTTLRELKLTEAELHAIMDKFRDQRVWQKKPDGTWVKREALDPENKYPVEGADAVVKRLNFVENWKKEELIPDWVF